MSGKMGPGNIGPSTKKQPEDQKKSVYGTKSYIIDQVN